MKKCLLLFGLLTTLFVSAKPVVGDSVATTVLFEFNSFTYQQDDIIDLTIHTFNFTDLYGYQVDIKENTPVFSFPDNTVLPYTVTGDSILAGGTTYTNAIQNLIGTIIYARSSSVTTGIDYTDNSLLIQISLIAQTDIDNIYDEFIVSDDYNDLLYNGANAIVKLSDSNGDPIVYDYFIDTTAPIITGATDITIDEGDSFPDVLSGVSAIDDYDDRSLELFTDAEDVIVTEVPGIYTVHVWAYDVFGNKQEETITVTVLDITAPVISGEDVMYYQITTTHPDYITLYTATDNVDGAITLTTSNIDDSSVNYTTIGTYSVTITVTDAAGNIAEKVVTVEVIEIIEVSDIVINNVSIVLYKDDTEQLDITVLPIDAEDKTVTYSSSDTDVVQISDTGLITAMHSGTAIITVTSNDNGTYETYTVTVSLMSPNLILLPSIDTITTDSTWTNPGCTAEYDSIEYDCHLESNPVTTSPGVYDVVYFYQNSDGDNEYIIRKVTVMETEQSEVLELNIGVDTVKVGTTWIDTGCTTSCKVVSNTVNTAIPGSYTVTYQSTSDTSLQIVRYITVYQTTPYDDVNLLFIVPQRKEGDVNA